MKLIDLKNIVDRTINLSIRNKELKVAIPYTSEKGKFGGTPVIEVESVRQGIDWNSGIFFISPKVDIKEKTKQLFINGVSKSFTASEVADMLGKDFSTIEEAIAYFDKIE